MYYTTVCQSPIGEIMLASNGEALCGLWVSGQTYFGTRFPSRWRTTRLFAPRKGTAL